MMMKNKKKMNVFDTMRSISFQIFLISLFLTLTVSSCTPSPSTPNIHTNTNPGTCAAKNTGIPVANNNNNVFGVPDAKLGRVLASSASSTSSIASLNVRGGELHEPETLDDVEALVFNAAANNQLVVIDFTAR
jgi:hypothetical protein